jgi:hypothetical protein
MMRSNRGSFLFLRWISIGVIFIAVVLAAFQLVRYSRIRSNYPTGMVVAGIPIGGLDTQHAAERLLQAYTAVPVEVRYRVSVIQIKPSVVGFDIDLRSMLAKADLEQVAHRSGRIKFPVEPPPQAPTGALISTYSRNRVYLQDEIASRYDQPLRLPYLSRVCDLQSGRAGVLDVNRAIVLIPMPSVRQIRGR